VQFPRDELADYVLGQRDEVVVGCGAASWHGRSAKVARRRTRRALRHKAGNRPRSACRSQRGRAPAHDG
jgi:hypothetical protein